MSCVQEARGPRPEETKHRLVSAVASGRLSLAILHVLSAGTRLVEETGHSRVTCSQRKHAAMGFSCHFKKVPGNKTKWD